MIIHHTNWFDRNIEVKEVTQKQGANNPKITQGVGARPNDRSQKPKSKR